MKTSYVLQSYVSILGEYLNTEWHSNYNNKKIKCFEAWNIVTTKN